MAKKAKKTQDESPIGHTKSGKAVYGKADHEKHSSFCPEDHKHAAGLHKDIHDRAKTKMNDAHSEDSSYKPSTKVHDFLYNHDKQSKAHTEAAKEAKEKKLNKKDVKKQNERDMHMAAINKLREEGKTAEAGRMYDKHIKKSDAFNLLNILKGGVGSGKKGHQTEGLSEQDLHSRREKFAGEQYARYRHHSGEGLNDAEKFKHGMVQDAKDAGYLQKAK